MNGQAWTEAEIAVLKVRYPHEPTKRIAAALGRSIHKTYAKANALGLKKTAEFLRSPESGILQKGQTRPESVAHQFKPGHMPANKGLRRPGWSPGRMSETQFKKGARTGIAAKNWRPIGTILPDSEGFLRIKVREAVYGSEATGFGNTKVWPLLNRYLWEQHHGPIPPKHIVAFKDGDRSNCVIENLELLSMADNAHRNRLWNRMPRELAEVIQLQGVLKRKLRSVADGKKQNQRSA